MTYRRPRRPREPSQAALFEFTWDVNPGGYTWKDGNRVLDKAPSGGEVFGRSYRPLLDEPGLFRIFATLDPTADAILAFANRYGVLGEPVTIPFIADYESSSFEMAGGEFLRDWLKEIGEMKRAVETWDCLVSKNYQGPRQRGDLICPKEEHAGTVLEGRAQKEYEHWRSRASEAELAWEALDSVQRVINQRLAELTSAQLQQPSRYLSDASPPVHPTMHLYIVPKSLLGALWLQFADAVNCDKRFERCANEACGKPIEIGWDSPSGHRTNRRTCSDRCRAAAFAARGEEARRLRAEGKSPREIARVLGTTTAVVKRWLAPRKRVKE